MTLQRSPGLIMHPSVQLTTGATGQRLAARLAAGRDGIRAALALAVAQLQELGQRRLAAGTRLHQAGQARAGLTRSTVAELLAAVSAAAQRPERGHGGSESGWERRPRRFVISTCGLLYRLTFHTVFDSRSVPTRRALLYPCRTGPDESSRRSSTLKKRKGM